MNPFKESWDILDGRRTIRHDISVESLPDPPPASLAGASILANRDPSRFRSIESAMKNFLPLLALVVAAPVQAGGLNVYPATVNLKGPRDEQRLVVAGAKQAAAFSSADPKIATVDANGIVRPAAADGATKITVTTGTISTTIPVKVEKLGRGHAGQLQPRDRADPDQGRLQLGACHGAQHGRGGFKLTLFGFDPAFDHAQIVQSAEGRRVVLSDPERSILLRKPALLMEHGGGERFKVGSREYRTLKAWLEDGAPSPNAKDAEVTSSKSARPAAS